jgi:hypothetical protein
VIVADPTNSGRVSLRVHTSPVTDATVCMRTFSPQRRDRHGPVSPKPDARTWPDRPKKSLLRGRSAEVFAVLGVRVTAMASTLVHGRFEDARITCQRQLNSDPLRQVKTAP